MIDPPTVSSWTQGKLSHRKGSPKRLLGVSVFFDFDWQSVFPSNRTMFRNGLALAKELVNHCPKEKKPAIILTANASVRPGPYLADEHYYAVVVYIYEYLKTGWASPASRYFFKVSNLDPFEAAKHDFSTLSPGDIAHVIEHNLNADTLKSWLSIDATRLNLVAEAIREVHGSIGGLLTGKEGELVNHILEKSPEAMWQTLRERPDILPIELALRQVWRQRARAHEEFEAQLELDEWSEGEWQSFFKKNTWIFGYGLHYQFLDVLAERPLTGGKDYSGKGGVESDFLLRTSGVLGFTVFVEIKTPSAQLVGDQLYRNRVYKLGPDLVGGVTQVQQQLLTWDTEGSKSIHSQDLLREEATYACHTRGVLVVGNLNSLGTDRSKIRTFETYKRSLLRPEVVTFDEMLLRASRILRLQIDPSSSSENSNTNID